MGKCHDPLHKQRASQRREVGCSSAPERRVAGFLLYAHESAWHQELTCLIRYGQVVPRGGDEAFVRIRQVRRIVFLEIRRFQ